MTLLQIVLNIVIVWCVLSVPISLLVAWFFALGNSEETPESEGAYLSGTSQQFSFRRLDEAR